jgi:hypothetical protein
MKGLPIIVALAGALSACAGEGTGRAREWHYQGSNTYLVIAATDLRAFLDLRSYDDDKVAESVVLYSPYMPPEFEAKDVAGDADPEFLVRTRSGGTGLAETHLRIYSVAGSHIRELGDFVVDLQSVSWPEPTRRETLSGKVDFGAKGRLTYAYTQVLTQDGVTVTNTATIGFAFDPKSGRFEPIAGAGRGAGRGEGGGRSRKP